MVLANAAGARLTELRELLGMTQAELAARTEIKQSVISDVEKGKREFRPELQVVVASSVHVPLSYFGVEPFPIDSDSVNFRKLSGSSVKSTKRALRTFREAERVAQNLYVAAEHEGAKFTPVSDRPVSPGDIEQVASGVRSELGLSAVAPVKHMMRAVERAGVGVVPLSRIGDELHGLDGHSGMSRAFTDMHQAVVAYVPSKAGDRQRFTVAHELGHLVLHTRRTVPELKVREAEAMRFAGALLYPQELAQNDISETLSLNGYARLKARYGISIQALIRRGKDLKLVSADRYRSLMIQLSSRGWRSEEPVEVGVERPALMWKLLSDVYGPTPYARASHDLGARLDDLKTWIPSREMSEQGAGKPESGSVVSLFGSRR